MTTTLQAPDLCTSWDEGLSFGQFVAEATTASDLWAGVYRQARIPEWARDRAAAAAPLKLLVLAEDWCNDAVSTVPVLARLAAEVPGVELRILRRDEHPELMDQYLSGGARAIPIVILLDSACQEIGHWGSRPAALQEWVMAHRELDKPARNLEVRKWYARDRGESVLREVLELSGGIAEPPAATPARGGTA